MLSNCTRCIYPLTLTFELLCLAGFGNLHGYVEMWHLNGPQNTCLLSKFKAPDTTYFEWSPDGMHILTATTSPRLRVGNGYKVFHYNGQMLGSYDCPSNQELWEVAWRPAPPGKYPVPRVEVKSAGAVAKQVQEEKPMAYVPPGRRNQSGGAAPHQSVFTKEYEPPSNLKEQQQSAGALWTHPWTILLTYILEICVYILHNFILGETKSRGQKKREAQKRAKEVRLFFIILDYIKWCVLDSCFPCSRQENLARLHHPQVLRLLTRK